jgi:peptide deformylase
MKVLELCDINLNEKISFNNKDIFILSQKMEIFCIKNKILSLSAVQVGINYNLFTYCINDKFKHILDCEYYPLSDKKFMSVESCKSISNGSKRYQVERYEKILVRGKEILLDKPEIFSFEKEYFRDMECCIFQHEIDHYDKKTIDQIGKEIHIQERIKI